MFETDIFPKKYVEIYKANKAKERKEGHYSLIRKAQISYKWITDKFDEGCAGAVKIKPCVSPEIDQYFFIIKLGIRPIKEHIAIIGKRKQDVIEI